MDMIGTLRKIFGKEAALGPAQLAHWEANGFLVLRNFMSPEELERVEAVVDDEWTRTPNDHALDVLTGPHAGQTFLMQDAPREARREVYKLNNLFARRPEIR